MHANPDAKNRTMEDKQSALINMITGGYAYLELLDELRDTDCFRGEIRQRVNLLLHPLQNALNKDVPKLDGPELPAVHAIIDAWKEIAKEVAQVRPEWIPALRDMIKMMNTDPDRIVDVFNQVFPDAEKEKSPSNS
jgi:hypothetical protein